MKILISILKSFIPEVIVVFGFIFLINSYIGNVESTIKADGIGYYEYLPSIFIHHDLLRKNNSLQENPSLYERVISTEVYVDYNNFKVNKYPCGTAILQLPFFTYAYLTSNLEGSINDGYQRPFHKAVFYAAIFYLFLSILFLKKILVLYDVKKHVIIFCQLILVFSTSVTHYANFEAGFSHIYSLFAVTAFIYFIKSYLQHKKANHFILASVFLGLVFLLRQPNIFIVLFIPFLAGSKENIVTALTSLFTNKKSTVLGIVLFFGISSIQLILWYLQTGNFFVYSYQGESFNFLEPHFFSILFSYKKGLFVYTPVLFIATLSIIWFAFNKHFYLFFSWVGFFVLLTYLLSSWWSWYYGCSYGLRAYIDYYAIFLIPFALMLDRIRIVPRIIIMILSLSTIPLNIIQTYQYKEYILHWIYMDKEKYWQVFLKTEDRYKGLVWKGNFNANQYTTLGEIIVGDILSPENSDTIVFNINSSDILNFNKVSIIQVLIDNDFDEANDTKIALSINNPSKKSNYYRHERYLIHFHQRNLNEWQTGLFNFKFAPITDNKNKIISLEVKTGNRTEELKNVRLKFLSKTIVEE